MPAHKIPIEERIRRHSKVQEDGCVRWTGSCLKGGRGKMKVNKRWVPAPRVVWELHNGPIPEGMWVLHTCDYAACVNPTHLELGTHAINQQHRYRRSKRFNRDLVTGRFTCGS